MDSPRWLMLEGVPASASPTLAWGVLLHDVAKPPTFQSAAQTGDRIRFNDHVEVGVRMAEAICKRLRFSNDEHRADPRAGGQSHEVRGRRGDARCNAQEICEAPAL